ncbi:MAG: helix-turn-helix domain-containing protein [Acidimicrobiia bacterium]
MGRARWAEYVRSLRAGSGLSMRAFAALAGTSASRLSDDENGRVSPTTDALTRLEHAAATGAPSQQ